MCFCERPGVHGASARDGGQTLPRGPGHIVAGSRQRGRGAGGGASGMDEEGLPEGSGALRGLADAHTGQPVPGHAAAQAAGGRGGAGRPPFGGPAVRGFAAAPGPEAPAGEVPPAAAAAPHGGLACPGCGPHAEHPPGDGEIAAAPGQKGPARPAGRR